MVLLSLSGGHAKDAVSSVSDLGMLEACGEGTVGDRNGGRSDSFELLFVALNTFTLHLPARPRPFAALPPSTAAIPSRLAVRVKVQLAYSIVCYIDAGRALPPESGGSAAVSRFLSVQDSSRPCRA